MRAPRRRTVALGLTLAALAAVGLAWAVPLPARLAQPKSQLVVDADAQWMRVELTPDDGGMVRIPVALDEVPEALVTALLAFEDQRFYLHPGVDPIALLRAAVSNLRAGRVVSGGSTITMQVARLLERRPRTWSSKLVEALRAVQLELRFSKRELLELYFGLAPYGGNLEGVGAAAYYYFDKPVSRLTLDEAATLAALPNAPTLLAPGRVGMATRSDAVERLRRRRNDVLDRLVVERAIGADDAEAAKALPIHAERRPTPFVAPHFSQALLRWYPDALRIPSTLDRALQRRAEEAVALHVDRLRRRGITQAAVVVIEHETRKVRAYVGSRDFFEATNGGQVDGALALRSPGSTLKPFVYAMGLDRGIIGTSTLLEDTPISFKDWSPGNFDGRWRGYVSAADALASSLNVPAVRVAAQLEPEGLVHLLGRAGFRAVRAAPDRYGLASVLGGVDVSLLELTNLYATLARGGLHQPWVVREDLTPLRGGEEGERLFSEGAAALVREMLTEVRRPELPELWRDVVGLPKVAWKTGTSYGRRDAWSVGFTRRYAIGVWVGNFDARGAPELVGVEAAAPLLFALAAELPGAQSDPWFELPPSVVKREVCALSGARPTPACPHARTELALEGVAPVADCALHVPIPVDDETGHRLCPRCAVGRRAHVETHVVWPPGVAAWLAQSGVATTPVPTHAPWCSAALAGAPPSIQSPLDGDVFVLRPGVALEAQKIPLAAAVSGGGGPVYWFVDDAAFAIAAPGKAVMLDPVVGVHRITAVDAEGRKTSVHVTVRAWDDGS